MEGNQLPIDELLQSQQLGENLQEPLTSNLSDRNHLIPRPEYIPGQVIVKFKDGIDNSQINALQNNLQANVLETTQTLGIQLWQIGGTSVEDAIAAYTNDPRIEYIEPNYRISVDQTFPDDPSFNQLWGLNNTGQAGGTADADIDAPEAWDVQTGNSVVVGVIDTGVDYNHPDLAANIWTNPGEIAGDGIDNDSNGYVDDLHGYDFVNNDGDPMDDYGHGTHVSGTIAADGNNGIGVAGVNWSAQIMGLKFLGSNGSGSIFDAVQAVEYATKMGAKLTNNSWGGGGYSQALYDAIAAAGSAGQLFVAAAGNSALNNDSYPNYPSNYDLDNIIAVAATDRNDQLSGFSNYGANSVDLGAPGSDVYSTVPGNGYATYSGTSMATPHVSGVASLIWAQEPNLTAQQVKQRILSYADPIPALQGKTVTGARLNAYNALTETPPPPGEIQGIKWNDSDGDGIKDTTETGLADWTIYLDQNQNNQLDIGEVSTVTDANGQYAFTNLAAGTYTVAEVLKPGWLQTYPGLNGGFETGSLAGWQTLGNTSVQTSAYGSGPPEGTYQALITNGGSAVTDAELESFLGLPTQSLDNLGNGNATQGSVIKKTFEVSAGEQLTFDWNFLTNEGTPSSYNDFGFVAIASGDLSELSDTNNPSFVNSPTVFNEETGFGTFSHTFTTAGTYTVAVGVVDVGDTAVDSGLLVDDFSLSGGGGSTVPSSQTVPVGAGQVVTGINFGNILLPDISISDVSLAEGNAGTTNFNFTVSLSAASGQTVTVDYATQDGTATAGQDYVGTTGSLTFNPGETAKTIAVSVKGDTLDEPNETFSVILSNANNGAIADSQGQGQILNDDTIGGTPGHDSLVGTAGHDTLDGGAGNDTIDGLAGHDLLSGGSDHDYLIGGAGHDTLNGGTGHDTLDGGLDKDVLNGGEGDDSLSGGADTDVLSGGSGDDIVYGGSGKDTLNGGTGDDKVSGGSGNDTLIGVDSSGSSPGVGELDTLIGGGVGSDLYILGDAVRGAYYNDGNPNSSGTFDFAAITDFNVTEDFIQLAGSATGYVLSVSGSNTGIYLDNDGTAGFSSKDELIGKVMGVTGLNLSESYFVYS